MMRRPGESVLPFEPYSGPAVEWASEETGASKDVMWREFDRFRREYKRLRPPWDEMGGRNMFEVWIAHVAFYMEGEDYDMNEFITAQHDVAPEPPWWPEEVE